MRSRLAWLVLLLVVGTVGTSCLPPDTRLMEHVLNRTGYGPDPWAVSRVQALGFQGYIEEQLQPQTIDDGTLETDLLARYPLLGWDLAHIKTVHGTYTIDPANGVTRPRSDLAKAKLVRALRSRRQLEQMLVDFWLNHFNVDGGTEIARWAIVTYERDAIRPYVLGRFRDMLRATAGHPAMLEYLDNDENFTPNFVRGNYTYGPNENYGREILELHTLGVDAGYTLGDIQEVARAFTGWTTPLVYLAGDSGFIYLHQGHDTGAKQVMGQLVIPAGGDTSDGEAVIDFLAAHPATAQRIARKLCQRFVADDPPPALVQAAAQRFLQTGGDLREVMRTILLSSQFLSTQYARAKTKRPFHYAASVARAVGVADEVAFANRVPTDVMYMGEDLYAAAPPTGYPEVSPPWRGEGPLLFRVNFASMATKALFGFAPVTVPQGTGAILVSGLEQRLVLGGIGSQTSSRVLSMLATLPEPQHTPQAAAVLLATPEFLSH